MLLQQIRCLVAVAEAGSFTAAATVLNLSQPALGGHVRNLEAQLGTRLLDRHSRGAALTPAGHAFLAEARAVLSAVDRARAAVQPFTGRTEMQVALGFTPTSGRTLVPDLLTEAAARLPRLRLHLRPGLSDDHRRNLLAGHELGAAFCYDPEPHDTLNIHPLYEEDLFLVGAPDLVDRAAGPIPLADMADLPLVLDHRFHGARRIIEAAAATAGIRLRIGLDVEPAEVKRALVMRRSHCTVVPYGLFMEEIAGDLMGARRITAPAIHRTLSLAIRRTLPSTVALQLLALVRPIAQRKIADGTYGWRAPGVHH
ncbi:LysR family transcriptional regulator [Pararoseomonas indoligenes]|uniref:LysR family transcriptional regulator n=1 Tax=Roseomonas indoligenes TaxID=2820811 RepID=A0A940N438_9PROT|nr:LysR family transcriptional regulator [Pararoseomonas indoligenes]MBP0493852.1 LysR family transcriptional regulator [Pararoseomonas indoligenes]